MTSLLKAVAGFLVDKARDRAAEKLKEGDVTDKKIQELIQREINDIKSKLDALSRKDLLTAIDSFQAGVRYLYQALEIGSETVRSATSTKETLMNATKALCNDGRNTELTKRRTCLISTRQRARYILQVVTCDVYSKIIS